MSAAVAEAVLGNLLVAALLALAASAAGRWGRRPAVTHALWLLVLAKLVTPPVVSVPVRCLPARTEPTAAPTPDGGGKPRRSLPVVPAAPVFPDVPTPAAVFAAGPPTPAGTTSTGRRRPAPASGPSGRRGGGGPARARPGRTASPG